MATVDVLLASFLRRELAARRWKTGQLADAVGVSRPTASKWLNGRSVPTERSCRRIAAVFELDPNEVLVMAGHLSRDEPRELERIEDQRRRRWVLRFRDLVATASTEEGDVQGVLIDSMLDFLSNTFARLR